MMTRLGFRAIPAVVCLALALPAAAQNLLNPHFDGTLDPWVPTETIYDADHSATADGTGSAVASIPDTIGIGVHVLALRQCVAGIAGGATYSFGGKMRIGAEVAAGAGNFFLEWHAATDCSDGPIGFSQTPALSSPPGPTFSWEELTGIAVAPASATAVIFYASVENNGPLPVAAPAIRPQATTLLFDMSIDDLFLEQITQTVPTLGGAGIAALLVSLAAAGFLVLRR